MYRKTSEELAQEFVENPANFVAEADLQIRLAELFRERLGDSKVKNTELIGTNDSYKRAYWEAVEEGLREGEIDKVHSEVSVQMGERIDIVVFKDIIEEGIEWVSGGSKRFSEKDVEAAFELKFVKNKKKFPTEKGERVSELREMDLSTKELQKRLDFEENSIGPDVRELRELDVDHGFLLLFSNNNYLYRGSLSEPEKANRNFNLYRRMGEAAVDHLQTLSEGDVSILYAHPKDWEWLC